MDTRKLKHRAQQVKNHVRYYRGRYAALGVTIFWMTLNLRSANETNKFLISKGIDPLEFTCPEWYDEIKNS